MPQDDTKIGSSKNLFVRQRDSSSKSEPIQKIADTIISQNPPFPVAASTEDVKPVVEIDGDMPIGGIPSHTLQTGTLLGHFAITKFIGGGGMGRVYLGVDTSLDRKVAIKVLQKQRAQDQASVARFMNEARSAARLNHEHIAQVYYAGQQDDMPFIAFEYVEGTNVRTLIEQYNVFAIPQAIIYTIQITHALAHASMHGVVHRDVKPSNILITSEGRAKLIDMGLARLLRPTDPRDDLTASGVTLGTFDYISPEQARDPRNADIRSDIYSLGCTLFYMLTGQPPFPEGTVLQKLLQHQGDEPPDIRTFLPGAPAEIAQIIQKMMAKDPRQRFQTPNTLLAELTDAAENIGLRPTGPGNLVWSMQQAPQQSLFMKNLPWIAAVVLFLACVVSLNMFRSRNDVVPPDVIPNQFVDQPIPLRQQIEGTSTTTVEATSDAAKPGRTYFTPAVRDLAAINLSLSRFLPWMRSTGLESDENSISGQISVPQTRYSQGVGVKLSSESLGPHKISTTPFFASISTYGNGKKAIASTASQNPNTPVLIVDPSGTTSDEGVFPTLNSAVAASGKNAVIELRFNGSLKESGKLDPVSFLGKQLVIQASKGFAPVLSFKPDYTAVRNSRIYLFLVDGSEVKFDRVVFEMDVTSSTTAAKWSFFEIPGSGSLTFTDCSFTIRNTMPEGFSPYYHEVSIFRTLPSTPETSAASEILGSTVPTSRGNMKLDSAIPSGLNRVDNTSGITTTGGGVGEPFSPPISPVSSGYLTIPTMSGIQPQSDYTLVASSPGRPGAETKAVPSVQLKLNDCVVRGETNILNVESARSVKLEIDNAFVAVSLPFLNILDVFPADRKEDSSSLRQTSISPNSVDVSMNHASVLCNSPLVRLTQSAAASPLPVKWNVEYSVFRFYNNSLAEFNGFLPQTETPFFEWKGTGDFIQGLSSFAETKASSSVFYPSVVSVDDWKTRWNVSPNIVTDIFQSIIWDSKPMNRMIPVDMSLLKSQSNPAYQTAPPHPESNSQEKTDAGQIIDLLQKAAF